MRLTDKTFAQSSGLPANCQSSQRLGDDFEIWLGQDQGLSLRWKRQIRHSLRQLRHIQRMNAAQPVEVATISST